MAQEPKIQDCWDGNKCRIDEHCGETGGICSSSLLWSKENKFNLTSELNGQVQVINNNNGSICIVLKSMSQINITVLKQPKLGHIEQSGKQTVLSRSSGSCYNTTFVCISCKFKAKLIKHCDLSSRFNQNTFFSRHKFFIGFKRGLHYAGFLFFMMSEASTYTRSDTMKPKLFGIQI